MTQGSSSVARLRRIKSDLIQIRAAAVGRGFADAPIEENRKVKAKNPKNPIAQKPFLLRRDNGNKTASPSFS